MRSPSCIHIPLDTDDEDQLGLGRDVGRVIGLGGAAKTDLLTLSVAVLLNVLLGTLEDDATLLLVGLLKVVLMLDPQLVFATCFKVFQRKKISDPKEG
jgi:hypothetical protein